MTHDGHHICGGHNTFIQQWPKQSPGHPTQANHPKRVWHPSNPPTQRAAAPPQAGAGATLASAEACSTSFVTTVGAEASS